ncbi:uncharacterized protein LOC111085762 [Limulus polyphemus]|uniref:Uncharacterized protein LOC111085762 n=1 Tax=Limulus polyphemus TaxID=6850 RepID=A0ABM1SD93_LIMPO|nr:uncharacterized protein LOC111085762 [Limulus polyphemus]
MVFSSQDSSKNSDDSEMDATLTEVGRQLGGLLDLLGGSSDLALAGLVMVPLMALLAMGAQSLLPFFGTNLAFRRVYSPTVTYRNKRDLWDRAGKALLYARNLYDIMAELENTFHQYNIEENECKLRAICEAHREGRKSVLGNFGDKIIELIRMEHELEDTEIIPLAKVIFWTYTDAAQYGLNRQADCEVVYSRCPHTAQFFLQTQSEHMDKGHQEM